jgi:hypothetical protein
MNKPTPPKVQPSLAALVADESLTALREAYHAAEAFQLSAEHQATKHRVQTTLTSAAKPQSPPGP